MLQESRLQSYCSGAVTDPQSPLTQIQLSLPVAFTDPAPAQATADHPPDQPTPDTAVEDVIRHFRTVQSRAEQDIAQRRDWAGQFLRLGQRLIRGLSHGVLPPESEDNAALPRISVVVPILDAGDSVATSLEALVNQGYPDLEIILIVRNPAPELRSLTVGLPTKLVTIELRGDEGLQTALRRGFTRATGEVLAWNDAGGICLPGILARAGAHFSNPGDAAVLSFEIIDTLHGWRFAAAPVLDYRCAFISRLAFDVVGGLDSSLPDHAKPDEIADALFRRLNGRYRFRRLLVHGAVGGNHVPSAEVSRAADTLPIGSPPKPPYLWFPPELPESVPVREMVEPVSPAPCPITGKSPDRFLFSSPDTRLGTPGLHDIWYHSETHCAAIAPLVSRVDARRLAAQQPPLAERRIIEPEADTPSPWRNTRFGADLLSFALNHPLPGWLLDRWPFKTLIGWTDRTGRELEQSLRGLLPRAPRGIRPEIRMLEVGCHTGDVLDYGHRLGWKTFGTEFNVAAAEAARAKGHTIWVGAADDILQTVPLEERFDIVFLGHIVERQADSLALIQRAARLLTPTGALVVATANLDSAQIRLFGPTWAHWHPPFHRVVLSRRSLNLMAAASGLKLMHCRSWSHPYWTWLSVRLNELGLAGVVPHGLVPDPESRTAVETLIVATKLLDDWRGRGDYLYAVMSPNLGN